MAKVMKGVSFNPEDEREKTMLEGIKGHNFSGLVKSLLFLWMHGLTSQSVPKPTHPSAPEKEEATDSEIKNSGIPFG